MSDEKLPVELKQESALPSSISLNRELLKQESTELLNQLTAETDLTKTQDLTYLFNINHSKKAMLRQETLDDTMDQVISELSNRVKDNPDEFDNEMLLKTATTIQNIMEKNATQTATPENKPLIQLNKTDININQNKEEVDPTLQGLSAAGRKNVSAFMANLFKSSSTTETDAKESSDE